MAKKDITPEESANNLSKIKKDRDKNIKSGQEKPSTVDDVNARLEKARLERLAEEEERRMSLEDEAGARTEEDNDNDSDDSANNYNNKNKKDEDKEGKESEGNEEKKGGKANETTEAAEAKEAEELAEAGEAGELAEGAAGAEGLAGEGAVAAEGAAVAVEGAAVTGAAEGAAGAVAVEGAAAAGGAAVGWPIILVVVGVILTSLIFLIIAVAIFAIFARGSVGNSFAQPMSKSDPVRVEFINKYLGDSPEKSPDNDKYPKLEVSTRDKEFLKNGGTHAEPSLQPDRRIFEVLQFLLEGNELSRKNGFSGFSQVTVSYVVSTYEDMPINREQAVKSGLTNSISAHQKGQAMDISALGMVKSKCKCGEKIPVKVSWQDDPPNITATTQAGLTDSLNSGMDGVDSANQSLSDLMNAELEAEFGLPEGTLSEVTLDNTAVAVAQAGIAQGAELPANTFVGKDTHEQAKIALKGVLMAGLGIKIDQQTISGNGNVDNYLHQIARNTVFKELGLKKLSQESDQTSDDEQENVPVVMGTEAMEQGTGLDKNTFSKDYNNFKDVVNNTASGAFGEHFKAPAQTLSKGLDILEMTKIFTKKEIEKKAQIPDGELDKPAKAKKQWWQKQGVINQIANQFNIKDQTEKDLLSAFIANPQDDDKLTQLAKSRGFVLADSQFNLNNGSSLDIYNIVTGTKKNEDGSNLSSTQKTTAIGTILAQNNAFSSIEKQYGLGSGSIAQYLTSDSDQKQKIVEQIGINRLAGQLHASPDAIQSILDSSKSGRLNKDQLTSIINGVPQINNFLKNSKIPVTQLTNYFFGTSAEKSVIARDFASSQIASQLGMSSSEVSSLWSNWFPTSAQKEAYNKLSDEEKDAYNKTKSQDTISILSHSGFIQSQTQKLGIPVNLISSYFLASKDDRSDILFNNASPLIEQALNLPAGTAITINDILKNPLYDSGDKTRLVATELIKSVAIVNFENKNSLPYQVFSQLLTGQNPEDILNNQLNTGYSILNAKLGLDYYDPKDPDKDKRFSIQNLVNGKVSAESVFARSSYITNLESQYGLERGTVGKIIDSTGKDSILSPAAKRDLYKSIGGNYLDNQFGLEAGTIKNLTDGKNSPNEVFDAIAGSEFMSEISNKYNLNLGDPAIRNSLSTILTGKVKTDSGYQDAFKFEKKEAIATVGSDIMGNLIAKQYGIDPTDAKEAMKGVFNNDYSKLESVGGGVLVSKFSSQLDSQMGLPAGTMNSLYNGIAKNNWGQFENTASGFLDSKLGLPTGSSMAIKDGLQSGNWNQAASLAGGYVGGQIDKALGLPSGFSYGAYMWITAANPMAFALVFAGPAISNLMGSITSKIPGLSVLGGIGGIGKCKGNTSCYRTTAQTNVHTAIEQLLRAPAEYGLPNNRIPQLITFSQERDVQPFIDEGLVEKAYGSDYSTVYGLFSMQEAYQQIHIGF